MHSLHEYDANLAIYCTNKQLLVSMPINTTFNIVNL
jgi:hypothetical protein